MSIFYRLGWAAGSVLGKALMRFIGAHSYTDLHYDFTPTVLDDVHIRYEICGVPECGRVVEIPMVIVTENGTTKTDPDWLRLAMLAHLVDNPINHPEVAEVGDRFDIFGEES